MTQVFSKLSSKFSVSVDSDSIGSETLSVSSELWGLGRGREGLEEGGEGEGSWEGLAGFSERLSFSLSL